MIITSNRTREIHDALARAASINVDYPTAAREFDILWRKAPGLPTSSAEIIQRPARPRSRFPVSPKSTGRRL